MSAKRALIVDDSRSARTFLTRVLERYDLQVDSAASAEEAIEYLIRQRPDVIFLDHLMPGMDGFEALTAIKNDPRTATIPVMMYTSQEGELYLSQARALGAMGVLPKQTRPADVSRALEALRLLGERPESEIATVRVPSLREVDDPSEPSVRRPPQISIAPPAGMPADMRAQLDLMLRNHGIELRRFVAQSLAQHTGQIINEVRALMEGGEQGLHLDYESPTQRPGLSGGATLWLAAAAAVIAIFAGILWYRSSNDTGPSAESARAPLVGETRSRPGPVASAPKSNRRTVTSDYVPPTPGRGLAVAVEPVPFGEPPLGGARIDAVQNILARLVAANFRGIVEIRSIPGRFCLQGTGDTVMLPAAEMSFSKCDQIGNPVDTGGVAGRESVAFANMLSAQHTHGRGAFDVQLSTGGVDEVAVPYPIASSTLTAGEWNRIAAANNRVEVHTHPQP
jgi:CheY-like chemotaxis protein